MRGHRKKDRHLSCFSPVEGKIDPPPVFFTISTADRMIVSLNVRFH
jgi:hypothetical protein